MEIFFFKSLCRVFPSLSLEKLNAGVFDVSQIQKLKNKIDFQENITRVELSAWQAFVDVGQNFLGNYTSDHYKKTVKVWLTNSKNWGLT